MARRDGTLTVEEIAAGQLAGRGPSTVANQAPKEGHAADVAAIAATAAAARQAQVDSHFTPQAIQVAAAGIIGAFDRFLRGRRPEQAEFLDALLREEIEELDGDQRFDVVDRELEFEKTYAAKARARLDRDLPKALSIADPVEREERVQQVLKRERRYMEQREKAVAGRALGRAEAIMVKLRSPEGGYWRLSPYVAEHTPDCLMMGGKVWPWEVLDEFHPPLHGGCPCELWEVDRARAEGLIGPHSFQSADQVVTAMSMMEAPADVDPDVDLALAEAFEDHMHPRDRRGRWRTRRQTIPTVPREVLDPPGPEPERPHMIAEADVEKWLEGSRIDHVVYHQTTETGAKGIRSDGPRAIGGNYGMAFYVATEQAEGEEAFGPVTLRVAVRVKKPLHLSLALDEPENADDRTLREAFDDVKAELAAEGVAHPSGADDYPARVTARLRALGFDSIYMPFSEGGDWIAVLDPEAVKIVDDEHSYG